MAESIKKKRTNQRYKILTKKTKKRKKYTKRQEEKAKVRREMRRVMGERGDDIDYCSGI